MDQDESKLITLHKKNELLRGYLRKVVGTTDIENLEITLVAKLGRKGKGTQLDPFFEACQ